MLYNAHIRILELVRGLYYLFDGPDTRTRCVCQQVCESSACTVQKNTTFSASGMAIIIRDHNWNLTAAADRFSSLI